MDLSIRPGTAPALLEGFEARSGLVLPSDLREFLELTNGVDSDDHGFSFWPLEAYESFSRQHARHAVGCPGVPEPDRYHVFCDYLHWSWAYAIRLGRAGDTDSGGRVVPVGMTQMFTVANSFTEFVDLYLNDSSGLYPPEE
ncbi:MAG TPA: SMI1/KNR4 family protein [Myxococcaceae bacterium]|nr:SMI1/KNR4 family protein [Myxococcaceae bacterium]